MLNGIKRKLAAKANLVKVLLKVMIYPQ